MNVGVTVVAGAIITAASMPRTPAVAHASSVTVRVGMPIRRAVGSFEAVARIARPILVFWSTTNSAAAIATPRQMLSRPLKDRLASPMVTSPFGIALGSSMGSVPKTIGASPRNTMISPRVTISLPTAVARLSRRITAKSTPKPSRTATAAPTSTLAHSGAPVRVSTNATAVPLNMPIEPWAKCITRLVRHTRMMPSAASA